MQEITNILNKVKEQLNVDNKNFIGLFLYGSQNYGRSYVNSDYDFICLVINTDKIFDTIRHEQGQVKVYNLNFFSHKLMRGDLECLEILFTRYKYINPAYLDIITELYDSIKVFGQDNRIKKSLKNKLKEHIDYLEIVTKKDFGFYNKKRFYWAFRVRKQLEQILAGKSFEESLYYPEDLIDDLMAVKTGKTQLSREEYKVKKNELINFLHSLPEFECSSNSGVFKNVRKFINDIRRKECTLV